MYMDTYSLFYCYDKNIQTVLKSDQGHKHTTLANQAMLPTEEVYCIREFLTAEGVLQQQFEEHSSDEVEHYFCVRTKRQTLDMVKKFLEQRKFTTEK